MYTATIENFRTDSQGHYRGPSAYRDGDNPTALSINTETGLWFDFVTGEGGDVIDYVRAAFATDFRGACKVIAEIIGRNPIATPRPQRPSFPESKFVDGALFRIGFRWFLERYLEPLKELLWLDETAATATAIRDTTKLLESAKSWTAWEAAWFMTRHRDKQFVTDCIAEARQAQVELAAAISTYSSTVRTDAAGAAA